jgi:hypothetical protein
MRRDRSCPGASYDHATSIRLVQKAENRRLMPPSSQATIIARDPPLCEPGRGTGRLRRTPQVSNPASPGARTSNLAVRLTVAKTAVPMMCHFRHLLLASCEAAVHFLDYKISQQCARNLRFRSRAIWSKITAFRSRACARYWRKITAFRILPTAWR